MFFPLPLLRVYIRTQNELHVDKKQPIIPTPMITTMLIKTTTKKTIIFCMFQDENPLRII